MIVVTTEKLPIKMWLDTIEETALAQARNLANLPFAFRHVALMPDSHVGYGMPIGGVLATRGVIVPNAVGVDIGCGMTAVRTSIEEIDDASIKEIMGRIRKAVPMGFAHHKEPREWDGFDRAPDIKVIQEELKSARCQLGTLGGGNHFIEIQAGSDGRIWLMLHSGSRNFGLKVAKAYHGVAKELCARWRSDVPDPDLSFLPMDTPEGREYFEAMGYCLDFAEASRAEMMRQVVAASLEYGRSSVEALPMSVHHNYAAMEHHFGSDVMVHRKGAIRARLGERGIIPGSMGAASFVTWGLGNEESFQSSSHGAGRRMGRKAAIQGLVLADEQAKMAGIIHGLRNQGDLDEAPGAYKDIDEVMANQADLVRIMVRLRPLASIKG